VDEDDDRAPLAVGVAWSVDVDDAMAFPIRLGDRKHERLQMRRERHAAFNQAPLAPLRPCAGGEE
jgi:hypothetical protein